MRRGSARIVCFANMRCLARFIFQSRLFNNRLVMHPYIVLSVVNGRNRVHIMYLFFLLTAACRIAQQSLWRWLE